MATLALAAAGAAVGGAVMPAGMTILGATLSGATIGAQIGAFAGSYVDQALFGSSGQSQPVQGPRLKDLHVTSSTEGEAIPRLYGRARLGGQVIWADEIEERTEHSGSSGGKGGSSQASTESVSYRYFASFAVALAEGPITGLGRIWADGQPMNLSLVTYRLHKGSETQSADSLISAKLGAERAPAFRGTAYIVFEGLPLAGYGNRLPQLSFEVFRSVEPFGGEIKGIVIIPGSGEFVYATSPIDNAYGIGESKSENAHTLQGATDWDVAIDQLESHLPNAKSASLIVSWFGTDLRAGHCEVKPGVELSTKDTTPLDWRAGDVSRAGAHLVSRREGRPAYGGTPSDASVVEAITDLKARGFSVVYTPFILMDVAEGNTLPDPYSSSGSQAVYPWRGRITIDPAPGQPGSPDKTALAATQIAAFVGTASPGDFSISGTTVSYVGPNEWSYRRMVLHQAHLAKAAGGVSAFVIGTELRGLTWARSASSTYPFVDALIALAWDVKSVLGSGTKVLYAADWSEYFGHHPQDGSGEVYFHLDPLWSSNHIDAIGIDLYWPLADWRDGGGHLDFLAGHRSIYDLGYLRSNVAGAEGFDWYYASEAARDAQARSAITDGSGKPWVFRYKDIKSWWLSQHFNRPGGSESASPTSWVPQSKPFWFMEIGCPAANKGANQPNVFVDPKSSESFLPYYSTGERDDLMQRRYLQALIQAFDPASTGYVAGLNPVSEIYGGRMVDTGRTHVYCWDARPYPEFPFNTEIWGDGDNWRLGHWITGRFASGPLTATLERILDDCGFADYRIGAIEGWVAGYVIDRVMSARDAVQPLELAYFFDSLESGGDIVFRPRGGEGAQLALNANGLVETRAEDSLYTVTRGQETELPASAKISYISSDGDYRQAVAEARRLSGTSGRISQASLPIVLDPETATAVSESWLFEAWATRERIAFSLPPSALGIEPGDALSFDAGGGARLYRVTDVGEHGARSIEARALDPDVYGGVVARPRPRPKVAAPITGRPLVEFIDLPLLIGDEPVDAGYVAALQTPWPGGVAIYASPETTGYRLRALVGRPAVMGKTLDPMPVGVLGLMDRGTRVRVEVNGGALTSVSPLQLFAGQNVAVIKNADGAWEVFQYEAATLVGVRTYELSGLIRGQAGTELAMRTPVAAGARFVLLTPDVERISLTAGEVGLPLNWRVGPSPRGIGDALYSDRQHSFGGIGSRPLSPVHVRATRVSNDIVLSWVRRTRSGGDSWEAVEVPLAEDSERYEVDIMNGAAVVRTLSVSTPTATYAAADQIADFGSVQAVCDVRIQQVSAVFGRGSARSVTL